jgi:hypothetical protein
MNGRAEPLKMQPSRRYTIYAVTIGVWLTGVLWLIYHYFLATQGKFGRVANPLELWWLKLHGAFSFAAIFAIGLLWSSHILRGWNVNWRRWSGGTLAGAAIVLTLTGYGEYYIDGQTWRDWNGVIHWVVGLAALAAFFIHWLSKSLPKRVKS